MMDQLEKDTLLAIIRNTKPKMKEIMSLTSDKVIAGDKTVRIVYPERSVVIQSYSDKWIIMQYNRQRLRETKDKQCQLFPYSERTLHSRIKEATNGLTLTQFRRMNDET